jgi:hypothetical protein
MIIITFFRFLKNFVKSSNVLYGGAHFAAFGSGKELV